LKLDCVLRNIENMFREYCENSGWGCGRLSFNEENWLVTLTIPLSKEGALLGMLNDMFRGAGEEFGMDNQYFLLNTSCEGLIISFHVPYLRKLKPAEVNHHLIIIESEFRDYFPPPMVEFSLCNSKNYRAYIDEQWRLRSAEWFKGRDLKAGDVISLWKYGGAEEYIINILKRV